MKMFLRSSCVDPDQLVNFEFVNPVLDPGSVRIGSSDGGYGISLLRAQPRPGSPPEFPIGEGYRVKFPVVTVPLLARWGLIQFFTSQPDDPNAQTNPDSDDGSVTDVRARLHDGSTEYWWTAGDWTAVTDPDADWNTLEEVKINLPSWVETDLGLVFELSTIDRFRTPTVKGFQVAYEVDLVSEYNDWIYGALVGAMQDELRPFHDVLDTSDGTTTFDFGALKQAAIDSWDFVEPAYIFNETADPAHRVNLLSSFDSGTGIATLSSAPSSGDRLLVRSTYAPVVAVTTDADYEELAAVPAVLFDRIRVFDIGDAPESSSIMDEFSDPPEGIIFPAPRRVNIIIDLTLWAPLAVDRGRLWEAVTSFLNRRKVITSPTTGEKASLQILDPGFQTDGPVTREGMRDGVMSFRLWDVHFHHREPLVAGDDQPGSSSAYGVSVVRNEVQVGDTTVTIDAEGS